jgi:hypothetical protein
MIRDLFFTILFFVLIGTLSAQHRDTVYVERETVTYDTVTVYDTVRVYDTLNIADYLRSEEFERLFYSSEYVGNLSLTANDFEYGQHQEIWIGRTDHLGTQRDVAGTNRQYHGGETA